MIVAQALTDGSADDAGEGIKFLQSVVRKVRSFTAGGAYDSTAIYKAAKARGAKGTVPEGTVTSRAFSQMAPYSDKLGYHEHGQTHTQPPERPQTRRTSLRGSQALLRREFHAQSGVFTKRGMVHLRMRRSGPRTECTISTPTRLVLLASNAVAPGRRPYARRYMVSAPRTLEPVRGTAA